MYSNGPHFQRYDQPHYEPHKRPRMQPRAVVRDPWRFAWSEVCLGLVACGIILALAMLIAR